MSNYDNLFKAMMHADGLRIPSNDKLAILFVLLVQARYE